jgi:hypothetical protein
VKHEIDLSRLQRRKPDMDASKIKLRDEQDRLYETVKALLRQSHPEYRGGICMDKAHEPGWSIKSFAEQVDALYCDTVYWMSDY